MNAALLIPLFAQIVLLFQDDAFKKEISEAKDKTKVLLERVRDKLPAKEDGTPWTDEEILEQSTRIDVKADELKAAMGG